jgi:serine/threonine-protein kinase RsbW
MSESKAVLKIGLLEGENPTIKLSGELLFHNKHEINKIFEELLEKGQACIRVDLSETTFIDSSGLSTLIKYAIRTSEAGGFIELAGISPQVSRAMMLCGAAGFFAVRTDEELYNCNSILGYWPDPLWHVTQFSVPATPEAASEARRRVIEVIEMLPITESDIEDAKFALGEALANAIKHGCRYDESKMISVKCIVGSGRLTLEVTDPGEGFDPKLVPPHSADLMLEGGMGIHIMRSLMDEVKFSFNTGTTVTLIKKLRARIEEQCKTGGRETAVLAD